MKFHSTRTPWLILPKPNPMATMRLFCLPYAGGSPLIFCDWHSALPPTIEVCPIQLPGRGMRLSEPPYNKLDSLLESLTPALRPFLNKPFAFFGHSMGGLIAFELARELRLRYGLEPRCLFLAGRQAPPFKDRSAATYNLPDDEFIEELRHLNGTPREILEQPELMRFLVPLLRAEFELCQTHICKPGPPLACPMSIFGGLDDGEVSFEALEAWSEYTNSDCSLRMLPGDHFFIHTSRTRLLELVSEDLNQLLPKPSESKYARSY